MSTGGPAEFGDPDFIAGMARELDASARRLEAREAELVARLGADRVAELAGLWAKEMDPRDEAELKRNMDWTDKELIWVWSRLERARARRVLAGRRCCTCNTVPRCGTPARILNRPKGKRRRSNQQPALIKTKVKAPGG